ncbi:MAG: hypothetical protein LBP23_03150, partial [Treponema sp.]|nr:hypothetical protein [Treponema sp.]
MTLLKKKLFAAALVSALIPAFLFFSSCEQPAAGLGTKVDLTAPVIEINKELGPGPNDFIHDLTSIYINASDDQDIKSVTVTYTYSVPGADGKPEGQPPVTVPARWDEASGNYVLDIDTKNVKNPYAEDPEYIAMADGALLATITVEDASGKKTASSELVYTVKNNPPDINMQIPRPKPNGEGGLKNDGLDLPGVVTNNYLMGVYEDLAGVGIAYPQIKFWPASALEPGPENDGDRANAGWSGVTGGFDNDPNDGWINPDEGLVESVKGERAGSFRYYLRHRKVTGEYSGEDDGRQLPVGIYKIKIRAGDINGIFTEWPRDFYDNEPPFMLVELLATGTPPVVTILKPSELYQKADFTIEAAAALSTEDTLNTAINTLSIEVSGRKKDDANAAPAVTLALWDTAAEGTETAPHSFNVEVGKAYYQVEGEAQVRLPPVAPDEVPDTVDVDGVPRAVSYVVFTDGNFNFTVRAEGDSGMSGTSPLSIYIDRSPPVVSVNSVTPHFSQDNPDATTADNPNISIHPPNTSPDPYRRWTVNSTVRIQVSSADNRGNALDENGNMKFKYLLLKGNDILDGVFTGWQDEAGNSGKTFGDYLYQRGDAALFDATKAASTPPETDGRYSGSSYPVINVSGGDGAYELNLKTHEWALPDTDYLAWLYIVSQDNAGNTNYDKILLNVDQDTDIPSVKFNTIDGGGATFVNESALFRITLSDDDALDEAAVEYRFSKDGGTNWSHAATAPWKSFPTFTAAAGLSPDGKTIEISSLDLRAIYHDLSGIEYTNAPAHPDPNSILNILGNESDEKKIEIRALDKLAGKVYIGSSNDGIQTAEVKSAVFKMDLNAPKIVPTTRDRDGTPLTDPPPPRSDNNPFGAPYQEEGFGQTAPVFYGDITELNPVRLSFTIDETTVNYSAFDSIPTAEPDGSSTAVWGTLPDFRWRFDTSPVWDAVSEGAHSFRLEATDKTGRSAVKQVTFFKDSEGPAISFITINGTSLTDEEAAAIKAGG